LAANLGKRPLEKAEAELVLSGHQQRGDPLGHVALVVVRRHHQHLGQTVDGGDFRGDAGNVSRSGHQTRNFSSDLLGCCQGVARHGVDLLSIVFDEDQG